MDDVPAYRAAAQPRATVMTGSRSVGVAAGANESR